MKLRIACVGVCWGLHAHKGCCSLCFLFSISAAAAALLIIPSRYFSCAGWVVKFLGCVIEGNMQSCWFIEYGTFLSCGIP